MLKNIARNTFKGVVVVVSGIGLGKYLSRVKFVKGIEKGISNYFNPEFIMLDGHKIYLDKEDSLRLSTFGKTYLKSLEHALYKKYIIKGDVVIDVGAFIGDDTLTFARLVGKKGKVYAFEMDDSNFDLLEKNVKANNYKNVVTIHKAVSNKDGKMKQFVNPYRTTGHRVSKYDVSGKKVDWDTKMIPSIKLDSAVKGKVNFIKIDTEGIEPLVIGGAKRIINENKNLKIVLEISPQIIKNFGISPEKYLKNFIDSGFEIYDLDYANLKDIKNKRKQIKTKEDIKDFMNKYHNQTTNIFLTREETNATLAIH